MAHDQCLIYFFGTSRRKICQVGEDELVEEIGHDNYIIFMNIKSGNLKYVKWG